MIKSSSVDQYIIKKPQWAAELELLRNTMEAIGLEETLKWGTPVYTSGGKNIVGLGAFKSYVGLWFFQGSLLKDKEAKLYNAQEGKATAMRQWRFSTFDEIEKYLELIEKFVLEAVDNEQKGLSIKPKRNKPLIIPPELDLEMSRNNALKVAFGTLNLTKKREYSEHILSAKREETKTNRLQKIIPMIIEGVGLHDKYKK